MNFQTVELFSVDLIHPAKKEEGMKILLNIVVIFRLNVNGHISEKQFSRIYAI